MGNEAASSHIAQPATLPQTSCSSAGTTDGAGGFADAGSRRCGRAEMPGEIRRAVARLAMTAALTRSRAALDALHQLLLAAKQQRQPQKPCQHSTLEKSDLFHGGVAADAGRAMLTSIAKLGQPSSLSVHLRQKRTDRQKDRQTDRRTDRQTDRLEDRQKDRQTGTDRYRQTDRQENRQTGEQKDRTDRQADR